MSPDQIFIYVDYKHVSLAAFMAMDRSKIRHVDASGCTALTELKADAAKYVDASGCTALTELKTRPDAKIKNEPYIFGGIDSRGYLFEAVLVRDQWRVIAGCRNYSIADARKHWGPGGESDRPDCLAFVEKIAAAAISLAETV